MTRFTPFIARTSGTTPRRGARHDKRSIRGSRARTAAAAASVPLRHRFSTLELLENRTLLSTYQVTNLNDSGAGSLRWAITQSNDQTASPGADTITFASNLRGSISLATSLPAITDALTIQGSTDGHGVPLVTLDGSGLDWSDFGYGLEVDADGSMISGLSVVNFVNSAGIAVYASNTVISGDYLGVAPDLSAGGNNNGVILSGAGNTVLNSIVADNYANGIQVAGAGNQILSSFVGTDTTGAMALGNAGNGIELRNASYTVIRGNLISANFGNGVRIVNSNHSTIAGNRIGTDATATFANPNGGDGVRLDTAASYAMVGGSNPADRNVITGNFGNGVGVSSGAGVGNVITGNYIGTDASGTFAIANQVNGVNLRGSGVLVTANVISGNSADGIFISGNGNTVTANFVGTAGDGASALNGGAGGALSDGIYVQGNNNLIGAAGAGNVVAYNRHNGVVVVAGSGNVIRYNSIFANGNLGIDLGSDGRTLNDSSGHTGSSNNFQDFPVVTGVTRAGGPLTVTGTAFGDPNATYTVDLYGTDAADTQMNGQGRFYLGSVTVTTDASGRATFSVAVGGVPTSVAFVVATATDMSGNTSEFSFAFAVPASAPVSIDTTTMLWSDGSSVVTGGTVTLTALVTPASGSVMPGGTVTFYELVDGANVALGAATLDANGQATLATGWTALGDHLVSASYAGATGFNASQSASLDETVAQDTTTTMLTIGAAVPSAVVGQNVTFTATVMPGHSFSGSPSGSVTFYEVVNGSNVVLGTVSLSSAGTAMFATSWTAAGQHTVIAVYNGATAFQSSQSGAIVATVNRDTSSIALSTSAASTTPNQSVTFTAVVSPGHGFSGAPTGSVTFWDNGVALATVSLSAGKATFTTSSLRPGNHTMTATYAGDGSFQSSTSASLTDTIARLGQVGGHVYTDASGKGLTSDNRAWPVSPRSSSPTPTAAQNPLIDFDREGTRASAAVTLVSRSVLH